jgi:hypothetical protein
VLLVCDGEDNVTGYTDEDGRDGFGDVLLPAIVLALLYSCWMRRRALELVDAVTGGFGYDGELYDGGTNCFVRYEEGSDR